jgi:uncharacterized protein
MPVEYTGPHMQQIGLLILQPSPFCNIDCDYCYLADRSSTKKMSLEVLHKTLDRVFESGLVGGQLSVVWHAGEPLAVPLAYYEEAFRLMATWGIPPGKIVHNFQTNGTLVNDAWCEFFLKNNCSVGVSVDGPAHIHDQHRKDRQGKGTHDKVMRGIEFLKKHKVPFHSISVITADALDQPDEVFNFFLENEIHSVGFNIEEQEGIHQISTLGGNNDNVTTSAKIEKFMRRCYELQKGSEGQVRIREFDRAFQALARTEEMDKEVMSHNDQSMAFGIISIDWQGNISTFSPELLGGKSVKYGEFCFGNTMTDSLLDIKKNPGFIRIADEIQEGMKMCQDSCEYFNYCGGGAPSNKYYENGSFASMETMYCRHTVQLPFDIVLADLEKTLLITQ